MKAIILAAGYGNRMRPLTDNCHKTMLQVAGKTIIGRIIDGLLANTVRDIVVVTGYRADELTAYLKSTYADIAFTFIHNAKFKETNNIYSMALAFEQITIDSDIILIESDLLYRPDVITRLIRSEHSNVALVDKYRTGMDGTVVTVEDQIITNVIPPHLQPETFDFSDKYKTLNIYKFSQAFCETSFRKLLVYYANVIDNNCYYELILGILIYMQKETIYAEMVEGENWSEVDDPNDLQVAEFDFNEHRKEILEHAFGGFWNYSMIDFCFIRNMHFPNASIISELKNTLPSLIHNYGSRQVILDKKMAWFLLCNETRVTALNGASQIYPLLRNRYSTCKALIPAPTFGEYTQIFSSYETYRDFGAYDLTDFAHKAKAADCIVVVNPNNPTGTEFPSDWLLTFAINNPSKTIIVDESFIEFSDNHSLMGALEKQPLDNVIIIKSLSKSLGIPGIRLGYVYTCNRELNQYIKSNIPIWNMNSIAEHFLEIILKHRNVLKQSFIDTIRDRTDFIKMLKNIPVSEQVFSSGANFVLVKLRYDKRCAQAITERVLSEHATYIKDVSSKFSDTNGYLRLAVRLHEENKRLCDILRAVNWE